MRRPLITSAAIGIAAMIAIAGSAMAGQTRSDATLDSAGTSRNLVLPEAAGNAPVISLGSAVDPQSGLVVDGYAIIHPREDAAKPSHAGGGSGKGGKTGSSTCYAFMAKGAVWRSAEPWVVNADNAYGLSDSFVLANLIGNIDKWEDAADGTVGDSGLVDILGDGTLTVVPLDADTSAPDGVNEVYFGSIADPGVVGVTIVWGVFGGPPQGRQIVEWDQVYDQVDYAWSSTGEAGKMDFENVSTHELGHSMGLTHPDDTCTEETMYRYTDFGETIRRTLNAGDMAGIDALY